MSLVDISQISGISGLQTQINNLNQSSGLVTGGVEWSGSGLIYDVTSCSYIIGGTLLTSQPVQVTLAASDPTDDRIDIVYVNTAGTVDVVTGSPSASPTKPALPDTTDNVEIAFILVTAGSTAPVGITYEAIYLENAGTVGGEWDGTTTDASLSLGDTIDPYQGSIHISHGGVKLQSPTAIVHMTFSPVGTYTIPAAGTLTFWWKNSTDGIPAPIKEINKIRIGFAVGGNIVGENVALGGSTLITYGFDPYYNGWQLVSIPLSEFTSISSPLPSNIDELRFYSNYWSNGGQFYFYGYGGWKTDNIRIQEGTEPDPIDNGAYLPLAGGTMIGDINLSNNVVIKASSGGGQINLRNGFDSIVDITTDNGGYLTPWLYLDPQTAWLGEGGSNAGIVARQDLASTMQGASIVTQNNTINDMVIHSDVSKPSSISSSGVTIPAGLVNVVMVGASGVVAQTSHTAYVNQVGFNESVGIEGLLGNTTLTSSRTWLLPDATGTIALTSDIPANTGIYGGSGALVGNTGITMGGYNIEMQGSGRFYTTNANASWAIGAIPDGGLVNPPTFQMYQISTAHSTAHYIIQQKADVSGTVFAQRILSSSVKSGIGTIYGNYTSIQGTHAAGTNVGGLFDAQNGLNNYALLTLNGDVGFGTLTPTEQLHVVGSIKMVDGNEGAGKVLTDVAGDGVGVWTAAGAELNGIFDAANDGGTIPAAFDYTLTDSIQQNAANSYIKHEDREFAMVGTALGDRSYSISRSLANTSGNGSVFMLNNSGLTDNDRIDFLLQNLSGGVASDTELNFRRGNIGAGSGGSWIDFMMQSGVTQNLYFNYNKNGSAYGDVIVQNGDFRINENLVYEATAVALADAIKLVQSTGAITWDGTTGGLFAITDDKDGQLFGVADVSGNDIMYADADWLIQLGNPFDVPFEIVYNDTTGVTETFVNSSTGIGYNNNGGTIDPSAVLDVQSTTQGFKPPNMTTAERNAIVNPAKSLMVYDTDLDQWMGNNGTGGSPNWVIIG